jgi:CheY-like chemotaxis protein
MTGTVLVVAADDELRAVLAIAFRTDGYRVQCAADDAVARERLAADRPDLLVVDSLTPLPAPASQWAAEVAGGRPLVLLAPAWGEPLPPSPADAVRLEMPFGRAALRRAVARAVRAAPKVGTEAVRPHAGPVPSVGELSSSRLLPALRFVGYGAVLWNVLVGLATDRSSSILVAFCTLLVLLASLLRQMRQELRAVDQPAGTWT